MTRPLTPEERTHLLALATQDPIIALAVERIDDLEHQRPTSKASAAIERILRDQKQRQAAQKRSA